MVLETLRTCDYMSMQTVNEVGLPEKCLKTKFTITEKYHVASNSKNYVLYLVDLLKF